MKRRMIAWGLAAVIAASGSLSWGEASKAAPDEEESFKLFRASMRMEKREFVKESMNLSEQEAAKFWSIYHQYEAELTKLSDRRMKLIEDYAANFESMSEAKAGQLGKTAFELRRARNSLLESYYKKIAKALSNRIAVRFAQVESVANAAEDVDLGASIPLMPKD
ncbi:hypothetical protein [Methyloterricola oryzae]|uniref:hypothetical protein n=1 Tax=Methyloterricola oryzae TaxID=1495050 RepID=UPI0011AF8EA5|nr:hypothetical protein [Methyloterricola oryzae]